MQRTKMTIANLAGCGSGGCGAGQSFRANGNGPTTQLLMDAHVRANGMTQVANACINRLR